MDQQIILKICVVGQSGVGKTSLLSQFCYEKFDVSVRPTIGCDFSTKIKLVNGSPIRIQLWDIAGQERYNSVSKMYVRGALGCVFVCAADDKKSFQQINKWKQLINENCDPVNGQTIPCILVENKIDLVVKGEEKEDFQKKEFVDKFCKQNGFFRAEFVSAKMNINVATIFEQITQEIQRLGLIGKQKSGQKVQKSEKLVLKAPGQEKKEHNKKKCC